MRGLGCPERLISYLSAGACGVVCVGMFVVSVSAPLGGSPRGVARPTREAGRPAGWLASQQKVPPSPGLIIISIIIIVMIVKLLIISSISTISFIQSYNMNAIDNNVLWIDHDGGDVMART